METSKILTADILDLLFDNRNKGYGAYELRKTYQKRIIKSLIVTTSIAGIVFILLAFTDNKRERIEDAIHTKVVTIEDIKEKQEKIPEPPKLQPPPEVRTEIFTPPVIVDKEKIENPPPEQEALDSARIGVIKTNGIVDIGIAEPNKIDDGRGVVDNPTIRPSDDPFTTVQVEASYAGNWANFLRKYLRPEVPVDNGAPAGRYTVMIQFIVDVEGNVSDITAITHVGYGMEEEAIRVIKKSAKWEPAFQNGIHVKAYRRQPITFEVMNDD